MILFMVVRTDLMWGNPGDDVASYSGNKSNYTITFYDSSGSTTSTYQADGYVKVKDLELMNQFLKEQIHFMELRVLNFGMIMLVLRR